MQEGFFAASFIGHVPDAHGLRGKDATSPIIDIGKNLGLQHFRRGVRDFGQPKVRLAELSILGAPRLFRIRRKSSATRRFHFKAKNTLGVQSCCRYPENCRKMPLGPSMLVLERAFPLALARPLHGFPIRQIDERNYSCLSVIIGSTRMARRAGT